MLYKKTINAAAERVRALKLADEKLLQANSRQTMQLAEKTPKDILEATIDDRMRVAMKGKGVAQGKNKGKGKDIAPPPGLQIHYTELSHRLQG